MMKKLAYLLLLTFAITAFTPSIEAASIKSRAASVKTAKHGKKHHKKHHKGKGKRHHKKA